MTSRERINLALDHREADRIARHDSPWRTTVQRWHEEGLPEGVSPAEYFGYEMRGAGADLTFGFDVEVLEETGEYIIERNKQGAIRRNWKHATSTPECLEFTITDRQTWDRHNDRLEVTEDRIDWDILERFNEDREAGYWCPYRSALGYDKTQGIVGSENLLMSMVTDPDWCREMFMTSARMICEAAQIMMDGGFLFDGAFIYDDMGYRNGLLFSPEIYRSQLKDAHAMVCDFFHERGGKVILHSCGCVKELMPDIIEAGVDCLQPLEVKAGMDVVQLKEMYGDDIAFMGGIDVRAMADPDPAAIEEEIRTKIPVARENGGYIYHSDHSVPDNVSFDRYCYVMELVEEYGQY